MWKVVRSKTPHGLKVPARRFVSAIQRIIAVLPPRYRILQIEPNLTFRAYRDCLLSRAIASGHFERSEQEFVRAFLRSGDVFVDIGANVGLFTLIAARAVGDSGRVVSLEPCRRTFERLLANIADNHITNADCHRLAVSDDSTSRTLYVSLDGYGAWNSFARPAVSKRLVTETVTTVRWDDFASANGLVGRVRLMKVDIEGWEFQFLAGAQSVLARADAPVMLVEFTEQNAIAAGNRCCDVFSRLEGFGYRMYHFMPDPPSLELAENITHFEYINLYAIKDGQLDDVLDRIGATRNEVERPKAQSQECIQSGAKPE